MKTSGILHAELAGHLARLGHGDTFLVADSGYPVPAGIPVVDLRVVFGLPRFEPVLGAILDEVAIEHAVIGTETAAANPPIAEALTALFPDAELVPTTELKARALSARFAVRTAEATPYANVLLTAGVGFAI